MAIATQKRINVKNRFWLLIVVRDHAAAQVDKETTVSTLAYHK